MISDGALLQTLSGKLLSLRAPLAPSIGFHICRDALSWRFQPILRCPALMMIRCQQVCGDAFISFLSSPSARLHLTTSKVMVIVWRLRGNIIRTVLYIANVLPLQWAQLAKTVHTARLGLEFDFLCFLGCMICLYVGVCMFCFYLG